MTKKPVTEPDPAPRICLRCDREFRSIGPGNRICPRCSGRRVDEVSRVPEPGQRVMRKVDDER